ncbi:MAG: hypothetical protein K6F50_08695 [Kiritimatiellae bacterium]|nr:hypothetical protein [Kiritimatiellia bacterium]
MPEAVTEADEMIGEIETAVYSLAKILMLYTLEHAVYDDSEKADLRRKHCANAERLVGLKKGADAEMSSVEVEAKCDLLVAREMGPRDRYPFLARLALDPIDIFDVLYVYSADFLCELHGYSVKGEPENGKIETAKCLWKDLLSVWTDVFDVLQAKCGGAAEIGSARAAVNALHHEAESVFGDGEMDSCAIERSLDEFKSRLRDLTDYLCRTLVVDRGKLDYGEVTRNELGRYAFEDAYGCERAPRKGRCCDRLGWLYFINDTRSGSMSKNVYLERFDETRMSEIGSLAARYERFWALMGMGKHDEALDMDLPYEDDRRKMGGVVRKIHDAISSLKIYARDSVDGHGSIREEAFRQFDWRDGSSILAPSFDVMRGDYYKRLAYVGGTESEYAVLRDPLIFFNECWDGLFRWLVRDVKCALFEPSWIAWRAYRDFSETSCYTPMWKGDANPKEASKLNELERRMIQTFCDLSEKELPRCSSEPDSLGDIHAELRELTKDGNVFLCPAAETRLYRCLDMLARIAKASMRAEEWRMLGGVMFIRVMAFLSGINDYELYEDDSDRCEGAWSNLRNTLDTYLIFLSERVRSRSIAVARRWLAENRVLTQKIDGCPVKRRVRHELLSGLRDCCRDAAIAIFDGKWTKDIRVLYAGNITWEYEDDDYMELGSASPAFREQAQKDEERINLARSQSPFFAEKGDADIEGCEPALTAPESADDALNLFEPFPEVTDKELTDAGGDARVVKYIEEDPHVEWKNLYYDYLRIKRAYIVKGFRIRDGAEEHLIAFLTTTAEEYFPEEAKEWRKDPDELWTEEERHDEYKKRYLCDVIGKMSASIRALNQAAEERKKRQEQIKYEESLIAKGRREASALPMRLGTENNPIHMVVEELSPKAVRHIAEAVHNPPKGRSFFTNAALMELFGVKSESTITSWRKGDHSPEGFLQALETNNGPAMWACAEKYRAAHHKGDAMDAKGLVRNATSEQMRKMGAKMPGDSRGYPQ